MKRIIIFVLTLVLVVNMVPSANLRAAENDIKYVKNFKLFVKTGGDKSDAESWCEKQNKTAKNAEDKWYVASENLNDATKADKGLKFKYFDKAQSLVAGWEEVRSHIEYVKTYTNENGIDKMSSKEYSQWIKSHKDENGIVDQEVELYVRFYRMK